jgi:hypothetical protein
MLGERGVIAMDEDIIKHDNAVSSWITLRVSPKGVITTILMVLTDLNLNAEAPDYQKDKVKNLIAVAVEYVRKHSHIDILEIEQLRQGSLEVTSIGL